MFTLTTIRAALALPMLSALLVTLSTGAIPAQAATVLSTAHYQKQLVLTCSGATCSRNFPAPGPKRQVNITRMSCIFVGTAGSTLSYGAVTLNTANDVEVLGQVMPDIHSGSDGIHTLNQAVDIQVPSSEHIQVTLNLASGTANNGTCTATGTLSTLQ
jgi:hypothetical protein